MTKKRTPDRKMSKKHIPSGAPACFLILLSAGLPPIYLPFCLFHCRSLSGPVRLPHISAVQPRMSLQDPVSGQTAVLDRAAGSSRITGLQPFFSVLDRAAGSSQDHWIAAILLRFRPGRRRYAGSFLPPSPSSIHTDGLSRPACRPAYRCSSIS